MFDEDSPLATVVAHVQDKPVPPSRRSELPIPPSLEEIILACLEKDPADRPASAADLDGLLAGGGLDGEWTAAAAQEWWTLHLPDSELPGAVEPEAAGPLPSLLTVEQ